MSEVVYDLAVSEKSCLHHGTSTLLPTENFKFHVIFFLLFLSSCIPFKNIDAVFTTQLYNPSCFVMLLNSVNFRRIFRFIK